MENNRKKWLRGLARTRKSTFGKIASFLGASEISAATWEELESLFIQSDIGVQTSLDVIEQVKRQSQQEGILRTDELLGLVKNELLSRLNTPPAQEWNEHPSVIMIAGVNGSGKTTTLAKLGKRYLEEGLKPLFVAADTYRAAATEQLQIWGETLNIPVISGQQNGDPGAVVFDGIQAALARKYDPVLIDTAGRLHTRYNLMEELKKVHRVAGKALPGAPHACWLVMDATTGQNALQQALSFQEAIPLDGIVLAKLDSSAKGGLVFAIQEQLGLPILYAGLGEDPADLMPFNPEEFVESILSQDQE
ncbi:MAG: signal recognition particle-docking protein FtsY [Chloroflexota bacterium]|nr:MAG: signal recognition particle-docking protein FtsY [Chloroflexota bacterium]